MTTRSPHSPRRMRRWLPLALGSLLAFVLTGSALASHERPGGGTPLRVPLVPAYAECTSPTILHAYGVGACPAVDESAGGQIGSAGQGQGSVKLEVFCNDATAVPCAAAGDQEDVRVTVSQTDVQCELALGLPFCPGGAGGDYAGPISLAVPFRLTDHAGGTYCTVPSGSGCTTVTTQPGTYFNIPFTCTPVGAVTPPGSSCSVVTSVDAITTPDMVRELQRSIWDTLFSMTVFDPGFDADPGDPGLCYPPTYTGCLTGDESAFVAAGWFTP